MTTAYLILTLITGQVITIQAPLAGCRAAETAFKAGDPADAIVNEQVVRIVDVVCVVES